MADADPPHGHAVKRPISFKFSSCQPFPALGPSARRSISHVDDGFVRVDFANDVPSRIR